MSTDRRTFFRACASAVLGAAAAIYTASGSKAQEPKRDLAMWADMGEDEWVSLEPKWTTGRMTRDDLDRFVQAIDLVEDRSPTACRDKFDNTGMFRLMGPSRD